MEYVLNQNQTYFQRTIASPRSSQNLILLSFNDLSPITETYADPDTSLLMPPSPSTMGRTTQTRPEYKHKPERFPQASPSKPAKPPEKEKPALQGLKEEDEEQAESEVRSQSQQPKALRETSEKLPLRPPGRNFGKFSTSYGSRIEE